MKKIFIVLALLMPTMAWAAKPSMLCKNQSTGTLYTVVVTGGDGEILFQIDAGEYLEGRGTKLENKFMGFFVKANNGTIYIVADSNTGNGVVKFEYNDGTMYQNIIHCYERH